MVATDAPLRHGLVAGVGRIVEVFGPLACGRSSFWEEIKAGATIALWEGHRYLARFRPARAFFDREVLCSGRLLMLGVSCAQADAFFFISEPR